MRVKKSNVGACQGVRVCSACSFGAELPGWFDATGAIHAASAFPGEVSGYSCIDGVRAGH